MRAQSSTRRLSVAERLWLYVEKTPTCWVWTGATTWGYGILTAHEQGRQHTVRAHRLSWELAHGPIPPGLSVLHRCDNRRCVNPEHLFLGTQADNVHDMMAKGRHSPPPRVQPRPDQLPRGADHWSHRHPEWRVRGERSGHAKLTAEQVREMRRLHATGGISYAELGRRFGVSNVLARLVVLRRAWRHVE